MTVGAVEVPVPPLDTFNTPVTSEAEDRVTRPLNKAPAADLTIPVPREEMVVDPVGDQGLEVTVAFGYEAAENASWTWIGRAILPECARSQESIRVGFPELEACPCIQRTAGAEFRFAIAVKPKQHEISQALHVEIWADFGV